MSYIEDNLLPNEELLLTLNPSGAIFLPSIVTFAITTGLAIAYLSSKNILVTPILFVGVITFGLSAFFITIDTIIRILTTEYGITNKRIISKTGFIKLNANEILLSQLESINTERNIIQALVGIGTINFRGTGRGKIKFQSPFVPI